MTINRDYVSTQNTYENENRPKYIVIHETDNYAKGADARRHASAQAAGHLSTSVHYYAGSDGVCQAAEHKDGTFSIGVEYNASHAVKDADNRNTINIEICVNSDGDYGKARENAIALVRELLRDTDIPVERVIRHFDARGKYCPRKMMDSPGLWTDFQNQIGRKEPEDDSGTSQGEHEPAEIWYRVGSGWKNGICQNQTGAYHNREFAVEDCRPGQYVYDEEGNIVYSGDDRNGQDFTYTQKQFIRDVQKTTGSVPDGIAGDETIGNTLTVSRSDNKYHPVVTSLERRMKALNYYRGAIEEDSGERPHFGKGMEEAVNSYQKKVLGYKNPDGEITGKKKTWESLLGML